MSDKTYSKTVFVTGGAGFIGSALIRLLMRETNYRVVNIDRLTYAGNIESLAEALDHPNHIFAQSDICDRDAIDRLFAKYRPDAVMHLAAESHVDRSIHGPAAFIETNIIGTYALLEATRCYWKSPSPERLAQFRFHHVSTDEVYGDLETDDPAFSESTPYAPSSPYSASKASSDHLVRAWHRTYGFPVLITNCSNNYGPYQFPEKLMPVVILNALEGRQIPVYGSGENIRDWLFVEDHARALVSVLTKGVVGRTYNIGGRCEKTNIEVVKGICAILDKLSPSPDGPYERLIDFVVDRPGHDQRYAIDDTRIASELGWKPQETFESGLEKTVRWYLENSDWVSRVRSGDYRQWVETNYVKRAAA